MPAGPGGLEKNSVILLEQIRTIDKSRLMEKVSALDSEMMARVNQAVEISLGLVDL
jgi:mRNA interferase MazF